MYIVTLEELDGRTQDWEKTYRSFLTEGETRDFVEFMLNSVVCGLVRNVRVWIAEELPYDTKIEIEFKFKEE